MGTPTKLSEFLEQAATQARDAHLFEGAIIFVAVDRALDKVLQQALAIGDVGCRIGPMPTA
jgi:hypothetical protein